MKNKDLVAQAVIHNETIHRCGRQLEEIKDGLGEIMQLITAFPELFEDFFIPRDVTGSDLVNALYTEQHLTDSQKTVICIHTYEISLYRVS